MAKEASMCLLFLSFLIICCSGTLLGFSYGNAASAETTFLKKNKTSQSQIHFSCFFCAISSILSQSKVHIRRILDDTTNNSPIITPPDSPAIITVPSTNPVPLTPTNPANSPVTVTNPVTAPTTPNPVTSIPPPLGNTNASTIPGKSWCVAKTGVPETTLQSSLDYCCGMDSVACSQIQQGGSCYNPNSLQNHASVAFNSYYQKNPAPTSCDFGGAATLVNTNPSSGSCIYTSSSGAGAGAGISNSGAPTSVFGSQSPPPEGADTSHSAGLRPFIGCMVMLISLVTGRLNMRQ